MTDSTAYEELLILEDELIDQYVSGRLSETDRADFENYFLRSPGRRQKVKFARALTKYIDLAAVETLATAAEPELVPGKRRRFSFWPLQNPVLNYSLAAALVLLLVSVWWLTIRSLRSPPGLGKIYAVALTPGGTTRSEGEIQTVSIPSGTDTLRLQLLLPVDQSPEYSAQLIAPDGQTNWQGKSLKPTEETGKRVLAVDLPANLLSRNTYRLKIYAPSGEEITSYTFRVIPSV